MSENAHIDTKVLLLIVEELAKLRRDVEELKGRAIEAKSNNPTYETPYAPNRDARTTKETCNLRYWQPSKGFTAGGYSYN